MRNSVCFRYVPGSDRHVAESPHVSTLTRKGNGHGSYPPVQGEFMLTLLWIAAAILVIAGILMAVRGQLVNGLLLIALGLIVGPGGVSIVG